LPKRARPAGEISGKIMPHTVVRKPLDLLKFVAVENEQFMISLVKDREAFRAVSHIQGLYDAACSNRATGENDIVVFQLLSFTHYHFLFSATCLMRCHLSEAFTSARVAIDAALIAAQIIHDRASQVAYTKREKPFDNFARYLGNLIRDGKPLPHPLVPTLRDLYKTISTFAGHADVGSFVHRVKLTDDGDQRMLSVEYFQFAHNDTERKIHALTICHTFVMILDVFSDFLVSAQQDVPKEWQDELHGLGQTIERLHDELKAKLPPEGSPAFRTDP
jgi:hypothetical protein